MSREEYPSLSPPEATTQQLTHPQRVSYVLRRQFSSFEKYFCGLKYCIGVKLAALFMYESSSLFSKRTRSYSPPNLFSFLRKKTRCFELSATLIFFKWPQKNPVAINKTRSKLESAATHTVRLSPTQHTSVKFVAVTRTNFETISTPNNA